MTEFRTFQELQQMGIKNHNPLTRELETNDGRRWFRLYNNSPQWMEITNAKRKGRSEMSEKLTRGAQDIIIEYGERYNIPFSALEKFATDILSVRTTPQASTPPASTVEEIVGGVLSRYNIADVVKNEIVEKITTRLATRKEG